MRTFRTRAAAAALVAGLALVSTACSDDDTVVDEGGETTEETTVEETTEESTEETTEEG